MDRDYIEFLAYMLYIHSTDAEDVYMEDFEDIKRSPNDLALLNQYYKEFEEQYGIRDYE